MIRAGSAKPFKLQRLPILFKTIGDCQVIRFCVIAISLVHPYHV